MVRAVFLDTLGTLLRLEPPWLALRDELPDQVTDDVLVAALRAEMAYYRDHAHEARDEASLRDLRERCAAIVSERVGHRITVEQLVEAIRFEAYPDVVPALEALRDRGLPLVVVSNWDYALPRVLKSCGLGELLDATVTSAEAGARKPDPAIFARALALVDASPGEALHVGDTEDEDVAGARAAGMRALLIDRGGRNGDISSLEEIDQHL